jgi:hypothetical protein
MLVFLRLTPVFVWFNCPVAPKLIELVALRLFTLALFWDTSAFDIFLMKGWAVFLSYPYFKGANLEDFILFDNDCGAFCIPEPIMVIGRGWKSNCWTFKNNYALEVHFEFGRKVIYTFKVCSAYITPLRGFIIISWHYFWYWNSN